MRVFHNIFVLTRSSSDRQRTLKWVLLVTVPRTVLDATASLRTASVRQDQRKYLEMVPWCGCGALFNDQLIVGWIKLQGVRGEQGCHGDHQLHFSDASSQAGMIAQPK